jgi:disulfide oxidoreductase YuzD
MDIKKRAEEYKNENGNANITNKDLLFYIIARLDDIEAKGREQDKQITHNSTCIKVFFIILPMGISIAFFIGGII